MSDIDRAAETIEYGDLEDALGWIVESPFRLGGQPDARSSGADILAAAALSLEVQGDDLDHFLVLGFTRVLNGDYGLDANVMNELLGDHKQRLLVLLGIAASRGKCPGP